MSIEAKISVAENMVFNKYGFKVGKRSKNMRGMTRRKTKYARRQCHKIRDIYRSQDRRLKYPASFEDPEDIVQTFEAEDILYQQLPQWYSDEQTAAYWSDLDLLDQYSKLSTISTRELWVSLLGQGELADDIAIATQGEKLEEIASIPNEEMLDALSCSEVIYQAVHVDKDIKVIQKIFDALDHIRMMVLR